MANIKKRDNEDTVWQVLTSFGFSEEDGFSEKERYFILDKNEAAIVSGASKKARADAVAACIESAFAVGADGATVHIFDRETAELLILFGFENILSIDENAKDRFMLSSEDTIFAEGTFKTEKTIARIDMDKLLKVCTKEDGSGNDNVSKSLVFAEEDADGVAYDICYTLRINGCIVEMYCGDGGINEAAEYAEKENASAIVRCFKDGCVEIKDMAKQEIIKTTISDFLGYYEEDDCGCEHHGEDCGCGHHHGE